MLVIIIIIIIMDFVRPILVKIHSLTHIHTIHGVNSLKGYNFGCLRVGLLKKFLQVVRVIMPEDKLGCSTVSNTLDHGSMVACIWVNLTPWGTRFIILKLLSQFSYFNLQIWSGRGKESTPSSHWRFCSAFAPEAFVTPLSFGRTPLPWNMTLILFPPFISNYDLASDCLGMGENLISRKL